MGQNVRAAATEWVNMGVAVIPIVLRTKQPAIGTWRRFQSSLPTEQELRDWFWHDASYAVVTGWRGLVVVDFDLLPVYELWAAVVGAGLLETYRVQTARGIHLYYFVDKPVQAMHLPGIDVKASGGYVLGAGSIHPSGFVYAAVGAPDCILRVPDIKSVVPVVPCSSQRIGGASYAKLPPATEPSAWDEALQTELGREPAVVAARQAVRIESFFPGARRTGDHWLVARCPFHDDANPSLWIDTERQICGCHAGCTSKPMDVINLVARLRGITNREAIASLARGDR